MRLLTKLLTIPGVRRHQRGDAEYRLLFVPEALDQVAGMIRAQKKRPSLDPEEARRLGSKTAFKATSGPVEAT
jgi:hypothetical protein